MDCIVCKATLENVAGEENQPSGGTAFRSHGHYGSTAFDPMDGTFLEVNICDPCLNLEGSRGNVLMGFPQPAAPRSPMVSWPMTEIDTAD